MSEVGNNRGGLLWAAVFGQQGRKPVAEPEEQNLTADGQPHALQTTAASEVFRGASSYSARADKVQTYTWATCSLHTVE